MDGVDAITAPAGQSAFRLAFDACSDTIVLWLPKLRHSVTRDNGLRLEECLEIARRYWLAVQEPLTLMAAFVDKKCFVVACLDTFSDDG